MLGTIKQGKHHLHRLSARLGDELRSEEVGLREAEAPEPQDDLLQRASNLHFSIAGGAWMATLRGRGISASAVVDGKVLLRGTKGTFSIDGRQAAQVASEGPDVQTRLDDGPLCHDTGVVESARQRILLVEDEANIASFVAMYLQKAGYEVGSPGTEPRR